MDRPLRFRLQHDMARRMAKAAIDGSPTGCMVEIKPPTRSLEQNAAMWARLDQLSKAIKWDGEDLTPTEWKDLLSACLRKQKVVRGLEGGLVFLGARTSKMGVGEMNDLLTLMDAFAAERGVVWEVEASNVAEMRR